MANLPAAMIAVAVAVASVPGGAAAQATGMPDSLRERVEEYQSAWSTHDPAAVAAFFSEDADMLMGNLPWARGRDAIEGFWRSYFQRQEPERRLTIDVISTRFLGPEVVLLDVATTTGGTGGGGEALPVRKARGTWVLVRENGEWLIVAMRGLPSEEDRIIRHLGR